MARAEESEGARRKRHDAIRNRSQSNLEGARKAVNGYNSSITRHELKNVFAARFRHEPYEWQLDVAESVLLGLDSVVIAGTGAGKTIPFMLPLLFKPEKLVVIISPLKVLQDDQVSQSELFIICTLMNHMFSSLGHRRNGLKLSRLLQLL